MANNVIFTDGFDYYTNPASKWDVILSSSGNSPAIITGAGRGGAGALYCAGNSGIGGYGYTAVQKNTGAYSSMYVGFAFNVSYGSADTFILQFQDAAGSKSQVDLWVNAAGNLSVKTGTANGQTPTVILGPSTYVFPANSFHYIEMYVSIGSSTGAVTVKVDQAVVLSGTNLNTQTSSNAYFNILRLGTGSQGGAASPAYIDDVYFDTLGFQGDKRINGQLPSGNGTTNTFTTVFGSWAASTVQAVGNTILDSNGNIQRVISITGDDKTGTSVTFSTTQGVNTVDNHVTWVCLGAPSQYKAVNESNSDGDISGLLSSTVGNTSRFTFPAISGSAISSVILWPTARKDDGGYRAIQASYKSSGTTATSGTDIPLGGNYQQLPIILPTDPNGNIPWTASSVNAAEFGVTLSA